MIRLWYRLLAWWRPPARPVADPLPPGLEARYRAAEGLDSGPDLPWAARHARRTD